MDTVSDNIVQQHYAPNSMLDSHVFDRGKFYVDHVKAVLKRRRPYNGKPLPGKSTEDYRQSNQFNGLLDNIVSIRKANS